MIYLDVCCLNRPFDDQTQERIRLESEAVLLTTDDRLLSKAREHRDILHVRVENPIVWMIEVTGNGDFKGDSRTDSGARS